MDPITHTLIATGLLFVAYHIGHWLGFNRGEMHAYISLCIRIKAVEISINEDTDEVILTYEDGREVTL